MLLYCNGGSSSGGGGGDDFILLAVIVVIFDNCDALDTPFPVRCPIFLQVHNPKYFLDACLLSTATQHGSSI